MPLLQAAALGAGFGSAIPAADAETLVTALSAPKVSITSNFTGTEIVVFGVVERDARTVSRPDPYDIVVVATGTPEDVVTRRKERLFGVWVNRNSLTFLDVPSFYSLHGSRPLESIASPAVLKRRQIGVDNLILPAAIGQREQLVFSRSYRDAFIRLKLKSGLYTEESGKVEFLSDALFRTTIPLPANVPDGAYTVTIHLFRGGALLASQEQELTIAKSGFEQITYTLAHSQSLLYGIGCVLIAMFTGWLAGVVFRRD
ncbi:TIGR02186 family protein [Breoghania sp. L-A4]|nr:TIGR02186 family protein [Breoghania sp. L-A4]